MSAAFVAEVIGESETDTLEFITAGTPYETCVICYNCGSGTTVNSVTTPHPVWTGLNGEVVVQGRIHPCKSK